MRPLSLYVILDKKWIPDRSLSVVAQLCAQGGADIIQYRNKSGSPEEQFEEASEVKRALKDFDVLFIVNDDPSLASQVDADGVHLGLNDCSIPQARQILGEEKVIGASTHNVEEAIAAEKAGANYIAVGNLFGSETKEDAIRASLETLKAICQAVSISVVGIGGITLENLKDVILSGAEGIALSKSLLVTSNILKHCQLLKMAMSRTKVRG